jgi:hypothetical protein
VALTPAQLEGTPEQFDQYQNGPHQYKRMASKLAYTRSHDWGESLQEIDPDMRLISLEIHLSPLA